jgi:glycine/D-amino acid oxidase-like deaminating enzyme
VTLFSAYSLDEPDPGAAYALSIASADAYLTLDDEIGVDLEYERCGGVMFAQTEEKLAPIRRAYDGYRRQSIPVEWLDATGVLEAEPAFRGEGIVGGVFCPLNGQLNPLMLCRALAQGARDNGARFLLGTAVEGITSSAGRIASVRTTAGDIACESVVNAAGAWAADVARMAGVEIPVSPGRGQIVITEPVPRFIHRIVMGASPAARQTRRGNVIIGSALEYAGFDKNSTLDTVTDFSRSVLTRFPSLRGLNVIRTWAGLRPMTPDHLPIIQMMEEPRGFCLATGHSHRGICYGAGSGQVVTDLITGKPPRLPIDAFRLERFGGAAAMEAHR